MSATQSLLRVENLSKSYPVRTSGWGRKRFVHALDQVSLTLDAGQTLAVVGESGCGKSTLAKCILGLTERTAGRVWLDGQIFGDHNGRLDPVLRRQVQVVFQDPYASLNPRRTVGQTVADPLVEAGWRNKDEMQAHVRNALNAVGLGPIFIDRHPHELSGGQRQRVAIARAMVLRPKVVICDEPVSSLDISIRAQVINLLRKLQRDLGIAYLFITHDLHLVPRLANRVLVMYLGQIVEEATAADLARKRCHPYSQALFSAAPRIQTAGGARESRIVLQGEVPNPMNPPAGCYFHSRCPKAQAQCQVDKPVLRSWGSRAVRCHFPDEE